jgi:hypothetical protein
MRAAITLAAALILAGCQTSAGRGGDAPAPIGAAARAKHGPEPVAKPPEDVGSAEDPAPMPAGPKAQ